MKKVGILVVALMAFFISNSLVYAVCETDEANKLNSTAINVKASYELLQRDAAHDPDFNYPDGLTPEDAENFVWMQDYFRIYITNLTEDLYVEVYDDATEETKTYHFSDSDKGTVSFDQMDIDRIHKYTVTVYSSDKTNCEGSKLYTTYVSTPMFNYISDEPACVGAEDFYACQKWLSIPLTDLDTLYDRIDKYKDGQIDKNGDTPQEQPTEEKKGFANFIKTHRTIVIVTSICVVAIGGLVTVIMVKKQRSKSL